MRALFTLLVACVVVAYTSSAEAHKIIATVFAAGDHLEGEVGFSNGDRVADALVQVFDADGNLLADLRTDKDGVFVYRPVRMIPHLFRVHLGGGHVANVTVDVDELPPIKGVAPSGVSVAADGRPAFGDAAGSDAAAGAAGTVSAETVKGLLAAERQLVLEALQTELRPLRREITAYKEKNDLQTIIGGIGYIAGVFGVAFYLAARRKKSDT